MKVGDEPKGTEVKSVDIKTAGFLECFVSYIFFVFHRSELNLVAFFRF